MAENVLRLAKTNAPTSDGTKSFTDGAPHVTSGGRLRDSLQLGFTTQRGKPVIRLFSDARNNRGQFYAQFVIKGTGGHIIRAKQQTGKGGGLRFFWIGAQKSMKIASVWHPSVKPNTWLIDALRNGFRK